METTTRDILAGHFADEWLLVTENDRELSERLYESASEALESDNPTVTLSDQLREEWEQLAEQIKDLVEEHISDVASLYVAQMLQGWGSYPFDIIARQATERAKEFQQVKEAQTV
jgi:hypothetical protein